MLTPSAVAPVRLPVSVMLPTYQVLAGTTFAILYAFFTGSPYLARAHSFAGVCLHIHLSQTLFQSLLCEFTTAAYTVLVTTRVCAAGSSCCRTRTKHGKIDQSIDGRRKNQSDGRTMLKNFKCGCTGLGQSFICQACVGWVVGWCKQRRAAPLCCKHEGSRCASQPARAHQPAIQQEPATATTQPLSCHNSCCRRRAPRNTEDSLAAIGRQLLAGRQGVE